MLRSWGDVQSPCRRFGLNFFLSFKRARLQKCARHTILAHSASPPSRTLMSESERLGKLRHDLSNPLSALLAEVQLLLLNESQLDPETLNSLREIEAMAIRMRSMLREI